MTNTKKSEAAQSDLAHPHDLLVKKFLTDVDLAGDLFKNYLADEWVELIDFDSLTPEPGETVDSRLTGLRSDLQFSARFKGSDEKLRVFVFLNTNPVSTGSWPSVCWSMSARRTGSILTRPGKENPRHFPSRLEPIPLSNVKQILFLMAMILGVRDKAMRDIGAERQRSSMVVRGKRCSRLIAG